MVIEWGKAAGIAYNIISLFLNDEISSGKNKLKNKVIERFHRRKIKRFCYSYFIKHNGTVITNPVFAEFIKNDQTIERLFIYTGKAHVDQTDSEYLNSEMIRIEKELEYPITVLDKKAIRGFLNGLLLQHRQYREKCLTDDSKQIIQNNDRNTKEIINSFESINEDTKNELLAAISAKGSLQISQENAIFKILNDSFWNGEFYILESIQPALHEKSESLDLWVNMVLNMALLNGENYRTFHSVNDIKNPNVREDAVRKNVIFSYLSKKTDEIEAFNVSGDLKELVERISSGDEWLFSESKEVKDNVECYNITPFSGLKQEDETIKNLQIIYIFGKGILGVAKVIDNIGVRESNFIVELLSDTRHYEDSIITCESETEARKLSSALFEKLWGEKNKYVKTCKELQVIYWRILLQAASVSNNNRVNDIVSNIPEVIKEELAESIFLARFENGEDISNKEVIDIWNKTKKPRIMIPYFAKTSADNAKQLISEISDIMQNPELVIVYIETYLKEDRYDEAKLLIRQYEVLCNGHAEFLVDKIQVFHDEEDVKVLVEKWNNRQLSYITNQTDIAIAHLLFDWKKYEMCLNVLRSLELKGFVNHKLKKLRAFSLINTDRTVEGLSILNELIPECREDKAVVGNILNCSLGLQREISEEVLLAAEEINTPEINLYLAVAYERRGDIASAKKTYWKSLLFNKNAKSKVYGTYWFFSTNHIKGNGEVEISDENTCIIADEVDGNRRVSLGILSKEYSESEPNLDDLFIVQTANAIKRGWIGKKVGAVIEYESIQYNIVQIKTMDARFSEYCLGKMIDYDNVKVLSVPQDSEPEKMREYFVNFLKENSFGNNKIQDLIKDYKDLSKVPLSLFSLSQSLRPNYIVLVYEFLKDPSLLIREWIDYDNDVACINEEGYILSFSSLILLFLLDVPVEMLIDNNVYLPKSTVLELRDEKDKVISEKKRDGGGTVAVVDDQLQFFVNSDDSKQELMKYVTELLEYAEKIPTVDNKKDFSLNNIPESQLRLLLGTSDLDAISICKTENYALISFEIFLVELNLLAGNKSITPLAYINSIEKDDSGLIGYLNKMVQFHMMNILNKDIYERIAKSTASGITEEWNQYIGMIDQQDGNYKNWIKEHFALVGQKYQQNRGEDQTINDIEKIFTVELYKLLEREVHYSMDTLHDEKGNLVIRTYMRVFDKKEQKYIEGLDQIIDSVFQIDFSDEQ